MKNSSEQKFWNLILLGLKYSPVITLPILSSLRQKGRLTPKLVVRSNRCRGQSAWQSSAWSLLLLMSLSLLVLPSESVQPSRGGKGTALAEEREDKTKTILLCFMILVIAVRKRVYRVERKRQ